MKRMNIMRFNDSASSPALITGTAPIPQPAKDEILVRIHAAGVTPSELTWYPTTYRKTGEARKGAIPSHEFSGVIEAGGEGVDATQTGREIFGMNDWFAEGATAEYLVTQPGSVADKPSRLSHVEAATVPIGALTAWQGLYDRARLKAGERVLIHGGSGAVGVFAIQLACRIGAYVITTASARNADFLKQLGAAEVIDYKAERFEEKARELDVVFDAVGGEALARSWNLLKPQGCMVTIAASSEVKKDERTEKAFFIVEPNRGQLTEIARLLDAGELKCFVDAVVPLARASEAYDGSIKGKVGRGKIVVSVGA